MSKIKKEVKVHYMDFENTSDIQDLRNSLDAFKNEALKQKNQEALFAAVGSFRDEFSPLVLGATSGFSSINPVNIIFQDLVSRFGGRGGGRSHFAQGKVNASYTQIKKWLAAELKKQSQ